MSIDDLIVNGGFETGTLPPWVSLNSSITELYSHSGFFSVNLAGGLLNSYIFQVVPVSPGEAYNFVVSLAKASDGPSAGVSISIPVFDSNSNFLSYILITNIAANRLPIASQSEWVEIYQTTNQTPLGASYAMVLINKFSHAEGVDIIVDDITLQEIEGDGVGPGPTGPTGITGPTGPTGVTGPTGSTDYAYIYSQTDQLVNVDESISFDYNGYIIGNIGHIEGTKDIILATPGDYLVTVSVTGADANQFALFLNYQLASDTIYGSGKDNQQNTIQGIINISSPTILNVRNNVSSNKVALQTSQGGLESNITASIFIQRLVESNSVTVSTVPELLSALQNDDVNIINLESDTYNLNTEPAITRTTSVRLQSTTVAEIYFADNQDLSFITIGNNVNLLNNNVYNATQQLFFTSIDDALSAANPYDEIILYPGTYNQDTQIVISQPLTLSGYSSENTIIEFDPSLVVSLVISSDDVTIKNLHLIGPTMESGDNWLFQISLKAFPSDFYENIIISGCIIEGGRRNGFIYASDLSIVGCSFIHTGNRNSLNIVATQGFTLISNNTFNGGPNSLAAITYETGGNEITSGTIVIRDNSMQRHSQFVLFNTTLWEEVDKVHVLSNDIDHEDRSGSSIILLPIADINQIKSIQISKNRIINPNPNRLAIFLDYRFGGSAEPNYEQIKVLYNYFDIVQPWGSVGYTIDPNYPVGFSDNSPLGLTLDIFDLVANTVVL